MINKHEPAVCHAAQDPTQLLHSLERERERERGREGLCLHRQDGLIRLRFRTKQKFSGASSPTSQT